MHKTFLMVAGVVFISATVWADGKPEAAQQSAKKQVVVSSLPENVKLIVGTGNTRNYFIRVRAIHALGTNLRQDQIEAFYKFLYDKLEKQELPDLQFNGLKNELVVKLMAQDNKPAELASHLVAMYKDKSFDPTWRDYCVQFFGKWYPAAPDNDGRKAMYDGLFEAVKEVDGSIAGAAIAQLSFLSGKPGFDRARIADLAYGILTDPKSSPRSRIVAMQVCAELHNVKALPIAREAVKSSRDIGFRMASMATIGALGDRSDIPLLEPLSKSSDIRLQKPAAAALKKLASR